MQDSRSRKARAIFSTLNTDELETLANTFRLLRDDVENAESAAAEAASRVRIVLGAVEAVLASKRIN